MVKYLLVALGACCFNAGILWAQATAQINGTVKDQSGAVLPGGEVTATLTSTGAARTTISDETGSFVLPNLPVGPYKLEVALPGFRTYVQSGIVLEVNGNPVINAVLQLGQVSEQIEVQANAAMVETRSTGVGQVIENQRILELPLNGRQVTDLIVLAGAAVQTGTSSAQSLQNIPTISVAGGFTSGTVYVLDGAMHNNPYDNLTLPLPFPDALQEFKVEASGQSAQTGLYSGGSVNSVTKGGTNEFHGDLFEFVRNDLFNARNYFATKNSTLKRNQFGGTVGGPIKSNKLFFFGGYQGTTVRQDPANQITFVPTAAMMAGDFTAFAAPACNGGRQITLRAPFVNNKMDPSLFSKAAVTVASRLPQTSDSCGLITYGARIVTNESQFVGKVDYQWSDKQSVFGRTLVTAPRQPVPYSFDQNLLNTSVPGYDNLAQSYAFGDTYLISPNTINAFRFALNRTAVHRVPPNFFSAPDIGINIYSYTPGFFGIQNTGGFAFASGGSSGQATYRVTTEQISDDLNLIRGTHQMSFGGNLSQWRNNVNANAFSPGIFQFNGQTTGLGLADFLAGKPSQFQQSVPNTTYMNQWYIGGYFSDTWRVTPRLNLNYGVRWEPRFPQNLRNGIIANFNEARYAAGIKSKVYLNAPAGFYYPGDPEFPSGNSGMITKWKNFAPRLGLAWDPKGDGRMSIRASAGIGYDMLTGNFYTTFISPPWSYNTITATPVGGFDNPWLGYPGGNPFPAPPVNANTPFLAYGNYWSVLYDNPTTTRYSWNLSIQRQIASDWLVSTSYIGSEAAHVWTDRTLNAPVYIPGGPCTIAGVPYNPCSSTTNRDVRRRLALTYPNVTGVPLAFVDQYEAAGTQSYHGLLLSVQRRPAKGVTVGTNYTWSHCIGDFSGSQSSSGGTPGLTYVDPNNRALDRGNCTSDRRQIFNLTAVAEMPQLSNHVLRAAATGWRLSGIYRWSTGAWLTLTSGVDRTLTGIQNQRPDQILANTYGNRSLTNFLNPAAFALPALGANGNMRRGTIEGPATWQFDTALSRVFKLRERQTMEVRVEAYNLTNSLRPGNPNTVFNTGTFGQITTALDPRLLQFALKYAF